MSNKYSKDHKKLLHADSKQDIVRVQDGVLTICMEAFDSVKATKVILPESVVDLESNSFLRAHNLVQVNLPSSLQIINDYAFQFCKSLKSIEIPHNVEYLGLGAFYGCDNLEEIIINGSFDWNENWIRLSPPFGFIGSIKRFVSYNNNFIVYDDMLFSSDKKVLFRCPTNKKTACLPEELESISDWAFFNCRYLEGIDIPSKVTYIGDHAFEKCVSLREIKLPDTLTIINEDSFSLCRELSYVQFPENLKEIRHDAFFGCSKLEFFYYPNNKVDQIKNMLELSRFKQVVHSPLDYTEYANQLKWLILFEDFDEIKDLLASDCTLILLGKDTISDTDAIINFFKNTFHKTDEGDFPYAIDVTLCEAYCRDCLSMTKNGPDRNSWYMVFTIENEKITQIICGSIFIHARSSSKHPVKHILQCLKKEPLTPLPNQMPCMKCGIASDKLLWLNYSVHGGMGGYKGIMSFCPHCKEEIQFQETLHYISR